MACNTNTSELLDKKDIPGQTKVLPPAPILSGIWSRPLPHLCNDFATRLSIRSVLAGFQDKVLSLEGTEHLAPDRDPFILVANHSQKLESILLPCLLIFLRDGKRIHFMADWNFALIPGVGFLFRRGQIIMLTGKKANPGFLNALKPLFTDKVPAFERARKRLDEGACVGIFPEGTINRGRQRLLKGQSGAARLSLESGCPLLPVGIRFPKLAPDEPVTDFAHLDVRIGAPLQPPPPQAKPEPHDVRAWHAEMMNSIARLSGKEWRAHTQPSKPCH